MTLDAAGMGRMMIEFEAFLLFLGAALLVAITPGPGIVYVPARTFTGRRPQGLASSFGTTGIGGLVHLIAGGGRDLCARYGECGSLHSAQARRSCLSDWLGFKTWNEAEIVDPIGVEIVGVGRPF